MVLVRITTTPDLYTALARHLVCWAKSTGRRAVATETGGNTLVFVVDLDYCPVTAPGLGGLQIGAIDVCQSIGLLTLTSGQIPVISAPGAAYATCAAPIPTATIVQDTGDVTRMTTKVTITLNGPGTVTYGEAGQTGDDGDVAQGAFSDHQYVTPGTYTVTVKSTVDVLRTSVHSVTVPYPA